MERWSDFERKKSRPRAPWSIGPSLLSSFSAIGRAKLVSQLQRTRSAPLCRNASSCSDEIPTMPTIRSPTRLAEVSSEFPSVARRDTVSIISRGRTGIDKRRDRVETRAMSRDLARSGVSAERVSANSAKACPEKEPRAARGCGRQRGDSSRRGGGKKQELERGGRPAAPRRTVVILLPISHRAAFLPPSCTNVCATLPRTDSDAGQPVERLCRDHRFLFHAGYATSSHACAGPRKSQKKPSEGLEAAYRESASNLFHGDAGGRGVYFRNAPSEICPHFRRRADFLISLSLSLSLCQSMQCGANLMRCGYRAGN